ncbi:MAG: MotA/TolQ/ExbB proton channel family protein [Pseudomonadota bacterium]
MPWDGYRYLLLARFAIYNFAAAALFAAVYAQGWLDAATVGLNRWLCLVIVAVFAFGLCRAAMGAWRLTHDLNAVRSGSPRPGSLPERFLSSVRQVETGMAAELLRVRLIDAISHVRYLADALVLLGLVGTVVGFIIALSGIEPNTALSVEKIGAVVSTLISGIGIALYTTLLGAVFHLWLGFNYRMLVGASVRLYGASVELGGSRVA